MWKDRSEINITTKSRNWEQEDKWMLIKRIAERNSAHTITSVLAFSWDLSMCQREETWRCFSSGNEPITSALKSLFRFVPHDVTQKINIIHSRPMSTRDKNIPSTRTCRKLFLLFKGNNRELFFSSSTSPFFRGPLRDDLHMVWCETKLFIAKWHPNSGLLFASMEEVKWKQIREEN